MAIETINPTTGNIEKTFKPTSSTQIEKKLSHAAKAFPLWSQLPIAKRITYIKKLTSSLEKNKESLAKLITLEMGRIYTDALAEIGKCIAIGTFYIHNSERILSEQHIPTEAAKSYVRYDALGVILGIMPWNYPFMLSLRSIIPALIAGNVFVLKHASNVPQCALALENIFAEIGFPNGVFTNLLIEGGKVTPLIEDDRIAAVTITGSETVGALVAEQAGKQLKKTVLELGGSDAFIVLEDADIKETVKQAVKGRHTNAGQACNSPKRFILSHNIAKEFTTLFVEESKKLIVGDPFDEKTNVGPLAGEKIREEIHRQVTQSVSKGARILHGGKKHPGAGFFYEVTVVDQVKKGMPLFDEEIFGPVSSLITVKTDEEAIKIANDTHLGLSASIWTKDIKRAHKFINNLHVGVVFVNQVVRSDPRLPFGGVKKSGYGRELGEFGIKEFTNIKTVVIK